MTKFEPDDLFLMTTVSSIHCVPALDEALCTMTTHNREHDESQTRLWSVSLKEAGALQLTEGPADQEGRWSPDGDRFAFISERDGEKPQVYIQNSAEGKSKKLSDFTGSVTKIDWSPDGTRMLIIATVYVDPDGRGGVTRRVVEWAGKWTSANG